eukprot:TRINITY_DN2722_c0_g1_i3.p2 TRINITY_DN2722_c0_g1~~TRINITY_DN2722_c0_g1_i3.p2  ORF type:complete len:287 (-),score=53.14 TRINITY_DN2722_c0_g1_i3:252-1112(-)
MLKTIFRLRVHFSQRLNITFEPNMDTANLIEKCRDELNSANVLLEKISNALRRYLMNQPLNDEDQALLFKNNNAAQTLYLEKSPTSPEPTDASDLQVKPVNQENKEKKTPEEYERLLAEKDAKIHHFEYEIHRLRAKFDRIKSTFRFSSVENISHNIHLFDDHLLAIKTQAEDMNQMSQLTMFQQNLRGGSNNGESNPMAALFGALGGGANVASGGGASQAPKNGLPVNNQNMGPYDFEPYLELLYTRWDQCVGRPEEDFDENNDHNQLNITITTFFPSPPISIFA